MKIISAVALLVFASACATPTPTPSAARVNQTTAQPTTTTTTTTTTTAPVAQSAAIPLDLAGRTAAAVDQQLRAAGFTILRYVSPDGSQVLPDPTWTVVSVEGAGTTARSDAVVYIKVDKPAPPPPPKTSTKTTTKATPKPAPPAEPPPPAAAYYKNCTEARAAGAAPVHRGEPGYGRHLDRDGDGVGCE
nr:excalibur calcium-binding domain-containing protein [Kibdelosporangium sp. MJ126-NF4]CEL23195.1 hypothetical protein [Kibdelosporangium sp. MJ126-NF4]CTQ94358.1 hypothetical protein [Kibdelosporangium sp. MJ126-NF4]